MYCLNPYLTYTLQVLAGVLVDHMLHVASLPNPQLSVVSGLLPHLRVLTKAYPRQTAEHFTRKLVLMHKNLKRGLNRGAAENDAKTWPGLPELVFLRILGTLWPTSDMRHVVVSPARLLMGSYLGLCKIRSFVDAASGLFLCTLFLQYENHSKRFVPETINFLIDVIRCLSLPRRGASTRSPLSRRHEFVQLCIINTGGARTMPVNQPHLVTVISGKESGVQTNVDFLGLAVDLLARFSEIYKALDGFVELYEPVLQTLHDIDVDFLNPIFQVRIQSISVCAPALNSIQGPNISNYRLHPETLRVFASESPASKPSSTQTNPNPIVQSKIRELLLELSPCA